MQLAELLKILPVLLAAMPGLVRLLQDIMNPHTFKPSKARVENWECLIPGVGKLCEALVSDQSTRALVMGMISDLGSDLRAYERELKAKVPQ